jgi:hypothetical protein
LEFFQHHFSQMGHRGTSCDPHLHHKPQSNQRSTTSRVASAAGRLRSNALVFIKPISSRVIRNRPETGIWEGSARPGQWIGWRYRRDRARRQTSLRQCAKPCNFVC